MVAIPCAAIASPPKYWARSETRAHPTHTIEQSVLNLRGVDMQARDIVARGGVMTKNSRSLLIAASVMSLSLAAQDAKTVLRSEERRVGKEC